MATGGRQCEPMRITMPVQQHPVVTPTGGGVWQTKLQFFSYLIAPNFSLVSQSRGPFQLGLNLAAGKAWLVRPDQAALAREDDSPDAISQPTHSPTNRQNAISAIRRTLSSIGGLLVSARQAQLYCPAGAVSDVASNVVHQNVPPCSPFSPERSLAPCKTMASGRPGRLQSSRLSLPPVHQSVEHRQHEQGEKRGGENAADHDCR